MGTAIAAPMHGPTIQAIQNQSQSKSAPLPISTKFHKLLNPTATATAGLNKLVVV